MITATIVEDLKFRFSGKLIVPVDPQYEGARAVFNAAIDSNARARLPPEEWARTITFVRSR
jgi:hypothetical protein